MYHYKTNAIFATPITGLDSETIMAAYKKNFEYLVSKGFTPKLNVMDNQATKAMKAYLTPQECVLQLVEPNNHRVNAAEQAIQTFKNRLIGPLGTTDVDFPIQLWDKMASQVQDVINLIRRSRIDLTKSAYEVIEGPYDWNQYLLAPLETKAIIYKDANTRALSAPHGLDAWLLGQSKDHYQLSGYSVVASNAVSVHQGGIALFWRPNKSYEVKDWSVHGPNVLLFVIVMGGTRFYAVGCYIPPNNLNTLATIVQAWNECSTGHTPFLLGDLNVNLRAPRDDRDEQIAKAVEDVMGVCDLSKHFL